MYILKTNLYEEELGEVLNDDGVVIGYIKKISFSIKNRLELLELDGSILISIQDNLKSKKKTQDLMNKNGFIFAKVFKKKIFFIKSRFYLKDIIGNKLFKAQGNYKNYIYKIVEISSKKIVAEVCKLDKWKESFLKDKPNYQNLFALRIIDKLVDRDIVLGFVLSINNILYTQYGLSDIIGNRRRLMRLRPFGP
jgi:uncharacterized protein YxjI